MDEIYMGALIFNKMEATETVRTILTLYFRYKYKQKLDTLLTAQIKCLPHLLQIFFVKILNIIQIHQKTACLLLSPSLELTNILTLLWIFDIHTLKIFIHVTTSIKTNIITVLKFYINSITLAQAFTEKLLSLHNQSYF